MIKAVIFDFDGVLCESVEVKTQAFRRLFRSHAKHLNAIVAYHERHGGISRFRKFEHIYRNILKQPLSSAQSRRLGALFTKYSLQAVIKAKYVPGALPFLKKYNKKLKLFVVSGTPQREMRLIVQKRGLKRYFRAVYGSPRTKAQLVRLILRNNRLKKQEVVFVGDSITDQKAAQVTGIGFVGRVRQGTRSYLPHSERIISGVNELAQFLV